MKRLILILVLFAPLLSAQQDAEPTFALPQSTNKLVPIGKSLEYNTSLEHSTDSTDAQTFGIGPSHYADFEAALCHVPGNDLPNVIVVGGYRFECDEKTHKYVLSGVDESHRSLSGPIPNDAVLPLYRDSQPYCPVEDYTLRWYVVESTYGQSCAWFTSAGCTVNSYKEFKPMCVPMKEQK